MFCNNTATLLNPSERNIPFFTGEVVYSLFTAPKIKLKKQDLVPAIRSIIYLFADIMRQK